MIIIKKIVIAMVSVVFFVSCSNYDNSKREASSEVKYEARTNVGKTLSAFKSLQENAVSNIISTAQEYYDRSIENMPLEEPPVPTTRSGSIVRVGSISNASTTSELSIEDIGKFFPSTDGKIVRTRSTTSTDLEEEYNEEEIVYISEEHLLEIKEMEDKINAIVEEYKKSLSEIKPDINKALTFDFVELSENGEYLLIGGDMIVDPTSPSGALVIEMLNARYDGISDEEIEQDLINLGIACTGGTRGHYEKGTSIWPNGVIRYKFRNISNNHKDAMEEAMRDWSKRTGFLKFENAVNSFWENAWEGTDMLGVVNIYNENLNGANGSSSLGRVFGKNTLNIRTNLPDRLLQRVTRHELGHTIGLHHEHQRWDRGNFITTGNFDQNDFNQRRIAQFHPWWGWYEFKWEQVDTWTVKYYEWKWSNGKWAGAWKTKKTPIYGYKAYWVQDRLSMTPTDYDIRSIMHYWSDQVPFVTRVAIDGIPAGSPIFLEDVQNITDRDVKTVKKMYGR